MLIKIIIIYHYYYNYYYYNKIKQLQLNITSQIFNWNRQINGSSNQLKKI